MNWDAGGFVYARWVNRQQELPAIRPSYQSLTCLGVSRLPGDTDNLMVYAKIIELATGTVYSTRCLPRSARGLWPAVV